MPNEYYSGQGRLYVAERNPTTGAPMGFTEIGNVPNVDLSVEVTKFEHKESQSGSRAVDVTIVQEKKGTFTMTLESMSIDNLALALWGQSTTTEAGTAVVANLTAYVKATGESMRLPVGKPQVSNVGITGPAATPVYEFGTSATDVLSLNGWVDQANGTVVIFDTATQTTKGATVVIADQDPLIVTYDHAAYKQMDAFTETSQERYFRFEGLNTINNKPVIVNLFKAQLDPLTGYGLINEEIGSFELAGSLLYDDLATGASKFFEQQNVS